MFLDSGMMIAFSDARRSVMNFVGYDYKNEKVDRDSH